MTRPPAPHLTAYDRKPGWLPKDLLDIALLIVIAVVFVMPWVVGVLELIGWVF